MAGIEPLYEAENSEVIDEVGEALADRAVHPLAGWKTRSHTIVEEQTQHQQQCSRDIDTLIMKTLAMARDLLAAMARQYEEVVKERDSLKKEAKSLKSRSIPRPPSFMGVNVG